MRRPHSQIFQRAQGTAASYNDARVVLRHVRELAEATHGGYTRESIADPDILSKAIYKWWSFRLREPSESATDNLTAARAPVDARVLADAPWINNRRTDAQHRPSADRRSSAAALAPSKVGTETITPGPETDLGLRTFPHHLLGRVCVADCYICAGGEWAGRDGRGEHLGGNQRRGKDPDHISV